MPTMFILCFQIVLAADIYEEEDLAPNVHGLYLGQTHSDEDVFYLLEEADR